MTPLDWITLQIPTLYVCDPDGRLRYIREPGYSEAELDPAPRFFMGRTQMGNVWRFRHDLPDRLVAELSQLCQSEPIAQNLMDEPQQRQAIRILLETHAPIGGEERGPAYWVPEIRPSAQAQLITQENVHLLEQHFAWKRDSRSGFNNGSVTAVVVEGQAVALCFCARYTAQAAEAGIETAEGARGKGYASAAAALWATAVRASGRHPLYSTSWDNLASQGVARRIGALMYGEDWWIA